MRETRLTRWFWRKRKYHPFVRHLRPRLMAMILMLVLPVCVTCMVLSVFSVIQSREMNHMNGQNGFSSVMEKVLIRFEYEGVDPLDHFPSTLASNLTAFCQAVTASHGKIYASRDGLEAWQVLTDGEIKLTEKNFSSLRGTPDAYVWEAPDHAFQMLVTFPYDFSLRHLPAWFWVGMILSALTLLLCPVLYRRLHLDILEPMAVLETAITETKRSRAYRIPPQPERHTDEFLSLYDEFNAMAAEVQLSHEKDVKLLETEMDNLRLQVNPHMLLNSYNMIYALAESKNYAVIQDYTLCLVNYFRYVLRRGQSLVSVKQELEFVDNFIHIQRIRFPGRFSYVYQADEETMEAQIPPLLIENFVENAIKYALAPSQPIEIVVSVRREAGDDGSDQLHIAITDTGSGIRPEVLEKLKAREPYIDEAGHRHIGIYNCFRRIELFYGEAGDIHFSSGANQGTQIYLIVPYQTADKEGYT